MRMQISTSSRDQRLRQEILVELAVDRRIADADVRVGVSNGIAHLAGRADTLVKRTAAEQITKRVNGVRGVVNRIEAPGAPSPARTINLNLRDQRR